MPYHQTIVADLTLISSRYHELDFLTYSKGIAKHKLWRFLLCILTLAKSREIVFLDIKR
jgi:hypothetical protein